MPRSLSIPLQQLLLFLCKQSSAAHTYKCTNSMDKRQKILQLYMLPPRRSALPFLPFAFLPLIFAFPTPASLDIELQT